MGLEALHEEGKPLGLHVSWGKTRFWEAYWMKQHSLHACGEGTEISEKYTYLGCIVDNGGQSSQEVVPWISLADDVMHSLTKSIWGCRYLCRWMKIRIFKSLVISVLLYGCETWTLNIDLKRHIDVFGTRCQISKCSITLI